MHRVITVSAFALAVCSIAAAQTSLSVDWEWKKAHRCSRMSPALAITGIPADTRALVVTMVDRDATGFLHGGGAVPHETGPTASIPEGALKSYQGPCPPNFSSFGHDYQIIVRAIAADGKTELARGSKVKTFSAATVKQ
jgi:phosphatidylethanolamine-binding protein (PEBP) family uncharacterized protein